MENELQRKINEEVTRYKNSLAFYAKKCEWDTFKINAGRLFDYLEKVEMSEFERKFFSASKVIIPSIALKSAEAVEDSTVSGETTVTAA